MSSALYSINMMPDFLGCQGLVRYVLGLDRERVVSATPLVGFHHQGIEAAAGRLPRDRASGLFEGLGETAFPIGYAYALAVEKAERLACPPPFQQGRLLVAELGRIAHHMAVLPEMMRAVGENLLASRMLAQRERFFGFFEEITGSRRLEGFFKPGGVPLSAEPSAFSSFEEFLSHEFSDFLARWDARASHSFLFKKRLKGVGALRKDEALDFAFTGPNLRACGVDFDLRQAMPYDGSQALSLKGEVFGGGDCYARYRVRRAEIAGSLDSVLMLLGAVSFQQDLPLPDDPPPSAPSPGEEPENAVYACVEGPEGETGVFLDPRTGRVHLRTPSFAHIQAVESLLKGAEVEDVPLIIASLGLSAWEIDR